MNAASFDIDHIGTAGSELARYTVSGGERVLMGWGRPDGVEVSDRPIEGRARGYVVGRGFSCAVQLTAFLGDYLNQARLLDACPMAREAIAAVSSDTESGALDRLM